MKTKYDLTDPSAIPSPALLYYVEGIRENIERAVSLAGGPARLWPHVKTHKMAEVTRMLMAAGIHRFKCATIAEGEMLGACGAGDVLLAYPPVGPNAGRFIRLMQAFPKTNWWTIGDDEAALRALDAAAKAADMRPNILIDVNMGMDRTGVPLDRLEALYQAVSGLESLRVRGLHCYDGHVHDHDPVERQKHADIAAGQALAIRARLTAQGLECDTVVMGGTPSFPCHVRREDVYVSPGTFFINDHGYRTNYPDLPFEPAAAILTRVISRPNRGVFTLDLGYKGIGADPQGVRGVIANLPKAQPVAQSEEHWVFQMDEDDPEMPKVGDVLYVIPTHICPTTALYSEALAVEAGRASETWQVSARNRKITI